MARHDPRQSNVAYASRRNGSGLCDRRHRRRNLHFAARTPRAAASVTRECRRPVIIVQLDRGFDDAKWNAARRYFGSRSLFDHLPFGRWRISAVPRRTSRNAEAAQHQEHNRNPSSGGWALSLDRFRPAAATVLSTDRRWEMPDGLAGDFRPPGDPGFAG